MKASMIENQKERFVVTFIAPHQRPTSGGVYAIQQFCRYLAPVMQVNLVVQKGPDRPVPGVNVYLSKFLRASEIPDGDAIILYADCPDGEAFKELPSTKGKKWLFLQGMGVHENPVVTWNLRRGWPVIACSTWLVGKAIRHGARGLHVPYGLDSEIFRIQGKEERNTKLVSMMTHDLRCKGTEDGLKALDIVQRSLPDTEVVLFGAKVPQCDFDFMDRPNRSEIASLFRESAVFVCSSWQEGFGMPGLEALACGVALATTDTKGSCDYAIDGKTALVTPPRDPQRLAESVIHLLSSAELRSRLTANAQQYISLRYQPWPQAVVKFGAALLNGDLKQQSQHIGKLIRWIDELDVGISAMLSSRRWMISNAIAELGRRATISSRVPRATNDLHRIMRKLRAWRKRYVDPIEQVPTEFEINQQEDTSVPINQLRNQCKTMKQRSQDIDQLISWIEEFDFVTSIIVNSWGWRIGNAIGELSRRALLKPRVPMATDHLEKVKKRFRAWKRQFRTIESHAQRQEGTVALSSGGLSVEGGGGFS